MFGDIKRKEKMKKGIIKRVSITGGYASWLRENGQLSAFIAMFLIRNLTELSMVRSCAKLAFRLTLRKG
jgi:hypothetical protein